MEMNKLFLVVIALVFCFAAFADSRTLSGSSNNEKNVGDSWCIAKSSTDTPRLYDNINFCCNVIGIDCKPIQPGGSCFSPDNPNSQASYVMNLYYQKAGKNVWDCDFKGTGLIVTRNPSYGPCQYPGQ